MFIRLFNIVTGRRRYWDDVFKPIIDEMLQKVDNLSNPCDTVMTHFLYSAAYFVEVLTNMSDQQSQKLIRIDCRQLDKANINSILTVLLSFFVFIFVSMNKWIKDDLMHALYEVTDNSNEANQTMQLLYKHHSKSKGQPDMQILSGKIWDRFAELTHYQQAKYPDKTAFFMLTLANTYVDCVKGLKEDTISESSYV